ncbi:MAG: hypothetical protein D6776_12235 [Planctomycetota bacterium]|nr:MAG: hypothetical protein D6776_12235 [Planctomycetota bacterium]
MVGVEQPVSVVLAVTVLAAGAAALAALPAAFGRRVPALALGLGYALSTGLMLGLGFLLMQRALERTGGLLAVAAALFAALYTAWTHRYTGGDALDPLEPEAISAIEGYRLMIAHGLHAASEGVALGAAMALDLQLGIALALAMAVQNVCEGLGLASVLAARGVRGLDVAILVVFSDAPQALLAVAVFAVLPEWPGALGGVLGFGAGALLFLTLTETLPAAYRGGGRAATAAVVSAAAGALILLQAVVH